MVEDDFLIRDMISEEFRGIGWSVIEADNATEAIVLASSSLAIDVLFTDIDLKSDLTGWDVADAFRSKRPESGVIYTSGVQRSKERVLPQALYISKPYEPYDVFEACRSLM